jgi:hypothetical protein
MQNHRYPSGQPSTSGPQYSVRGPYNQPRMYQNPAVPRAIPSQYSVDAYGRPLVQHSASRMAPAQAGMMQHTADYSGHPYPLTSGSCDQRPSAYSVPGNSNGLSQSMARGLSFQSTSSSGSFPSPQSPPGAPKQCVAFSIEVNSLTDGYAGNRGSARILVVSQMTGS